MAAAHEPPAPNGVHPRRRGGVAQADRPADDGSRAGANAARLPRRYLGLPQRRPAGRRQHVSAAFQSARCPNRLSLRVVSTTTASTRPPDPDPQSGPRVASSRRDVGMRRGFFSGQDRPGPRGGHPGPGSRPRRFVPEGGALVRRLGAICHTPRRGLGPVFLGLGAWLDRRATFDAKGCRTGRATSEPRRGQLTVGPWSRRLAPVVPTTRVGMPSDAVLSSSSFSASSRLPREVRPIRSGDRRGGRFRRS